MEKKIKILISFILISMIAVLKGFFFKYEIRIRANIAILSADIFSEYQLSSQTGASSTRLRMTDICNFLRL